MSPLPEDLPPESGSMEGPEFSAAERSLLLNLAHESIASAIEHRTVSLTPPSSHLAEARGVFTTLYSRGELRGCVGLALAVSPLYRAVAETAQAAAFEDTRFSPLRSEELGDIEVSLSILSPLKTIQPEQIEIGRHGLVISLGSRRGLLLPQVPVERGWDREKFLEQTCVKAGLPANAWSSGAMIEAFTAEVFGDKSLP
jgi:AmmeMemoRadiSam system protein A